MPNCSIVTNFVGKNINCNIKKKKNQDEDWMLIKEKFLKTIFTFILIIILLAKYS